MIVKCYLKVDENPEKGYNLLTIKHYQKLMI